MEYAMDNFATDEKGYLFKRRFLLRRTSFSEQIFSYLLNIARGIRKPESLILHLENSL
jgi:hypothetical protein